MRRWGCRLAVPCSSTHVSHECWHFSQGHMHARADEKQDQGCFVRQLT